MGEAKIAAVRACDSQEINDRVPQSGRPIHVPREYRQAALFLFPASGADAISHGDEIYLPTPSDLYVALSLIAPWTRTSSPAPVPEILHTQNPNLRYA